MPYVRLLLLLICLFGSGTSNAQSSNLVPQRKNALFGYMNTAGELITPHQYTEARYFSNGYAAVKNDTAWGFIDLDGKETVPCIYEYVADFSEDKAAVRKNGLFGYINPKGKLLIEHKYKYAGKFEEGIAIITRTDERVQVINTKGKNISKPYAYIGRWKAHTQRMSFRDDDLWGYLNFEGKMAIPATLESVTGYTNFHGGRRHFRDPESGYYGFIDRDGNVIVAAKYKRLNSYFNGRAPVYDGTKWQYLDVNGNVAIHSTFESASRFGDGLAKVKWANGESGFIDTLGRTQFLLKPQYEYDNVFFHGVLRISWEDPRNGKLISYIDKKGELLLQGYEEVQHDKESRHFTFRKEGRWGLVDRSDKVLIPPMSLAPIHFKDGVAKVVTDRLLSYVDTAGTCIAGCNLELSVWKHREPTTITVGKTGDYPDLQSAIDACEYRDTIKIMEGTYLSDEHINIDYKHRLFIYGEGNVELLCNNYNDDVIQTFQSSDITFKNLHMRHTDSDDDICAGAVISLSECYRITIKDCDINGCGSVGVWMADCQKIELRNNHIHRNWRCAIMIDFEKEYNRAVPLFPVVRYFSNTIEFNGADAVTAKVFDLLDSTAVVVRENQPYQSVLDSSDVWSLTPAIDGDRIYTHEGTTEGIYMKHAQQADYTFHFPGGAAADQLLLPVGHEAREALTTEAAEVTVHWKYGYQHISPTPEDKNSGYWTPVLDITAVETW